ncbi:hypothetical protein [Chitinophaga rhizosphaerae]|uniref:hypothetical protein n=1 Tax=Chitinophaga rhizosphaerae TaxID=1864947 RepID=UPI000F81291F|nr:hypothetical protein [Chitinophaga rhizosphaerae]
MFRLTFILPAMIVCGLAACQSNAAKNAQDATQTASPADSSLPAVPELFRDTAMASAFGLPDTVTIGSQLYRVVPSTEALFESAAEFKPDTSEAKNIAPQQDLVRREGNVLHIKLKNGSEKEFRDNAESDGEDHEVHIYNGYLPAIGSFVIGRFGYETYDVLLVDEKTGAETPIIGLPQLSPDGKKMIVSNLDLMAAFTFNGLEYYIKTDKGLEKLYDFSPEKWGPESIKWLDANVLVGKFGVLTKENDLLYHYVRLEPVRK